MKSRTTFAAIASILAFGSILYNLRDHTPSDSVSEPLPGPHVNQHPETSTAEQTSGKPDSKKHKEAASEPLIDNQHEVLELANTIQNEGWKIGCTQAQPRLEEFRNNLLHRPHTASHAWEEMVFITAGCLSEIQLDERSAIDLLKRALEVKPRDAQFMNMLGTSYLRSGQDLEAEQLFTSLLADNELSQTLWNSGWAGAVHEKLAIVKLRLGTEGNDVDRLNDARHLLQTADEFEGLTDVSPLRHGQIAAVDFSLGRYAQAVTGYERALSLLNNESTQRVWNSEMINKMKAEYTMKLGQIYFIQGHKEKSELTMKLAIDHAKASSDPLLFKTMKAIYDNTIDGTEVDLGDFNEIRRIPLE